MIRFFIFCFMFLGAAAHAEDNAAFTDYETIIDAAFPVSRLSLAHRRPTDTEEGLIAQARSTVLQLIEIERSSWFSKIAKPPLGTPDDWYRVQEALKKTPVWVCQNGCTSCPLGDTQACIATKRLGQYTPSVIFLNACVFGVPGCKGGLLNAMKKNLAKAAYFALHGPSNRDQLDRIVAAANQTLEESAVMIDRLASACPGPFPSVGEAFLRRSGHVRVLNEFAGACAKNYLAPFGQIGKSSACKMVLDFSKLDRLLPKSMRVSEPEVLRCDSFCETVTCGLTNQLPRVMVFGSSSYLSIPEGACDGSIPTGLSSFVEKVVRDAVSLEAKRKPGVELFLRACLKTLVPEQQVEKKE